METLHRTYVEALPDKVREIEDLWMSLCEGIQIHDTLHLLYHAVHKLNGSGPMFGLPGITQSTQYLEEVLNRHIAEGIAIEPTAQDRQRVIDDLASLKLIALGARAHLHYLSHSNTPLADQTVQHKSNGLQKKPTVLVAEDEPMLRQKVALSLREEGFHVEEADNGLMALIQAKKHQPDVILMGYLMPVMDGIEAIRQIRDQAPLRGVPIILSTTPSKIKDAQRASVYGVDTYITKPFDPVEVTAGIRALLSRDAEGPTRASPDSGRVKKRVLIADDDAVFRKKVSLILQEAGFEVEEADNGLTALQQAQERRPDMILMDVMMPMVDGLEATRHIRDVEALRDVPIIMQTANVVVNDVPKALTYGVDAYIAKPLVADHIVEKIKACLAMG